MTYKAKLNMKPRMTNMLSLFVALLFSFYCATSLAMPKVAEDENAPVTTGADVTKPKLSAKSAKPKTVEKHKKTTSKKSTKAGKPTKKTKAVHRRK